MGEIEICAREGCEETYIKRTHNQKYHEPECCRLATNSNMMLKYYSRQSRRQGIARFCFECGVTKLSRYNDKEICNSCKIKKQTHLNDSLGDLLSHIALSA